MKKLATLFLLALLPLLASAYDAEIDGIYYNLYKSDKTATVTFKDYNDNYNSYTGSVNIPEQVTYNGITYSVTWIGENAFNDCSGLTEIKIPNSVIGIESSAFYDCSSLTEIKIPNSVIGIGSYAFSGCSGLTSIVVDSGNTKYDSRNNCNAIVETATNTLIAGCKNSVIPNNVTSIGICAFQGCSGLTEVTIPNSVTSIGDNAFYGCNRLTYITIPNNAVTLGSNVFHSTAWYNNQPDGLVYIGNILYKYKYKGTMSENASVSIKDGTSAIAGQAFGGCTGLVSVTIPSSVTNIGRFPFRGCSNLTSISVDSDNENYDSRNNCNAIIETGTNTLIAGCRNTIIPNSVTSIEWYSFYNCRGLTEVTIPNSVTTIGQYAFMNCSDLKYVTIGKSVTEVQYYSFYGCTELTDVYMYAEDVPFTQEAFSISISNATLHVPKVAVDTYKNSWPWSRFGTILAIEGNEPVADGIAINETNFHDENFRNWILEQEYGKDGILTPTEIASVTSIDVSNKNIKSLQGIEFFTALTELLCYSNQLTSLNVSGCTAMTYLQCGSNQLTSLDVSGCTKLVHLLCFNNLIKGIEMDALVESLPTSSNGSIYVIDYYSENNVMTTTQVAAAKAKGWIPYYNNNKYFGNYEWLEYAGSEPTADGNAINETNFPDENFRNWILEQEYGKDGVLTEEEIASVTSIDVSNKSIKSLQGIELFTELKILIASNNQLTALDVSKNTNLIRLDCDNNRLTTLDISKNTLLTTLYSGVNQITALDVSNNTALEMLECSNNKLTSLELSKITNLKYLQCHSNQLTSLDLSNNTMLFNISCGGNPIEHLDLKNNKILNTLYCWRDNLTSLDLSNNTNMKTLYCQSNKISGADMDGLVESLPTVSNGSMYVINSENEGNVITTIQVAVAKAKGWTPQYFDGSTWLEYAGSEVQVGDVFTAKTKEGVTMTFKITDAEEKACQVGNGDGASVDVATAGQVTIPETASGYKVTAIGDKGFYNCSKLTHIWLHEGIDSIGSMAFYGCTSLVSLDIPHSIVRISSTAFEECSPSLKVSIPSTSTVSYVPSPKTKVSVTIKPSSNPEKQAEMERIYIPKSVISIEERAYSNCKAVKKIEVDSENTVYDSREDCNAIIRTEDNTLLYGCQNTKIPATVTVVADYAFEGHSNLKTLYCYAVDVPTASTNVFNDVDISKATLYVPRASIEAYKTTAPWSGFGNFKAVEDVTGVNNVSAGGNGIADGKYLKGGNLVIIKNGKEYNAAGAVKK